MTADPTAESMDNLSFVTVLKGNPTPEDTAAIREAFHTLVDEVSTHSMPYQVNAVDNWGEAKRQFDPIHAYSPSAYSNLR